MLKNLAYAVFGGPVFVAGAQCRWCKHPTGAVAHAPIPVCTDCWRLAYANANPGARRGNLWETLMEQFPAEARELVRQQSRNTITETDILQANGDSQTEALRAELDATRLLLAGKEAEAAPLRARAASLRASIAQSTGELRQSIADLDSADSVQK